MLRDHPRPLLAHLPPRRLNPAVAVAPQQVGPPKELYDRVLFVGPIRLTHRAPVPMRRPSTSTTRRVRQGVRTRPRVPPGTVTVGSVGEEVEGFASLVSCSPVRLTPWPDRKARDSAATWKASPGMHLVDSSRMREPSGYSHISAVIGRMLPSGIHFTLSTKNGPIGVSHPERCLLARASGRTRVGPSRTVCVSAGRRHAASRAAWLSTTFLSDAEQTNPPGIASTSTPKPGVRRSAPGSSEGTTGRSFTVESPRLPWTRRVLRMTPPLLRRWSGVSRKKTWRICASRASIFRPPIVAR